MIFYDFDLFAPNPWIAWIFAQEKGLSLERRMVDLFTRENRREPFISEINPLGELPALQLDDGHCHHGSDRDLRVLRRYQARTAIDRSDT